MEMKEGIDYEVLKRWSVTLRELEVTGPGKLGVAVQKEHEDDEVLCKVYCDGKRLMRQTSERLTSVKYYEVDSKRFQVLSTRLPSACIVFMAGDTVHRLIEAFGDRITLEFEVARYIK